MGCERRIFEAGEANSCPKCYVINAAKLVSTSPIGYRSTQQKFLGNHSHNTQATFATISGSVQGENIGQC